MESKKPAVMVVDDEPMMLKVLGELLGGGGFDVLLVRSAAEALEALDFAIPSVILSDVKMPGMDGLGLCREVMANPRLADVPVLFITGHASEAAIAKGYEAGAVDYISKPFNRTQVLERVRVYAKMHETLVRRRREQLQFEAVASATHDAIVVVDDDDRIVFWNPAAEEIFGYTADEVRGERLHPLLVPPAMQQHAREAFLRFRSVAGASQNKTVERHAVRKDGTALPIELSLAAFTLEGAWSAVGIVRNIEKRKALEEERDKLATQQVQAQKLEAIGQLAAGIAHEINTPTQYVSDNTTFLERGFGMLTQALGCLHQVYNAAKQDGHVEPALLSQVHKRLKRAKVDYLAREIPRAISQSLEGITRISKIVGAMKEFAHPSDGAMESVDLHRGIQSTITVARNEWKYVAEIDTRFDLSLPEVTCVGDELNQVILNMIVNAAHAIAAGRAGDSEQKGRITISTANLGEDVEIRIADDGPGIPEAIRHRVFDPFFTTKDVGKGTGQGLALAHSVIVQRHKGTLDLESEVGQGTTFVIRLPISGAPDSEREAA